MRPRPSARLLIVDPLDRVLLFRFVFKQGALAGADYWATPGGGVEAGETFEQAAVRELWEETGYTIDEVGPIVLHRSFPMMWSDGIETMVDERYFHIRVAHSELSREGWTDHERNIMVEHRWWTRDALRSTTDPVYPEDLAGLLDRLGSP